MTTQPGQGDRTIANVIFCSVLVLIESLQVLIVLVLIFSFIPIPQSPLLKHLFSRQLAEVFPKRDMSFYHFFVALVIIGQIALLMACRKKLSSACLAKQWRGYFIAESGWLFLMLFAIFKFFVYDSAEWARHLLYAAIGGSILSKIFWKELRQAGVFCCKFLLEHSPKAARVVDFIFPLLIAAIIFVPDLKAVVARIWIGDSIIHMDTSLMAQAWAYTKGTGLNVDIYSPYGVGMTVFISMIAKLLGGLSYEKIIGIMLSGAIVYFILCYFFLRIWLKDVCLAMAGVLLAIKWQVFHQGNYPFVFTYPYSTVLRYWFDMMVMFLILAHIRRRQFYLLVSAGAVSGLALMHITDTGVYLLTAYVFYLFCWAIEAAVLEKQSLKDTARGVLLCLVLVLASAFFWFFVGVGGSVWSKVFWKHMFERADYFFVGHGNLPMYKSLLDGDYSSSLMGFMLPLVYSCVLLGVVSLCFLRKIDRQHILAAVWAVYGLGLYHYYVLRSGNTAYYTVCIPFVFLLCWLGNILLGYLRPQARAAASGIVLAGAAFALLTTHAFLSYPNMFNFSANPVVAPAVKWPNKNLPYYFNNTPRRYPESFKLSSNFEGNQEEDLRTEADFKTDKELKEYFSREFDFNEDARLIDRYTAPGDPVALISSFETRILMQADRKPFFYYFPLILSRPMHMRMFGFSILWTSDQLAVIMGQLEKSKPAYVFMEKLLLTKEVPQTYLYLFPEELYILSYLNKNYTPYDYGRYLVALKRNSS